MKVKIDESLCEGHAKCMEATEIVFEVRGRRPLPRPRRRSPPRRRSQRHASRPNLPPEPPSQSRTNASLIGSLPADPRGITLAAWLMRRRS